MLDGRPHIAKLMLK